MTDYDYIYEVYKEKSFSQAAKKLYITQPALSASIKKIENELGIVIFDRSTSPITVTEEGMIYIESIEKIMHIKEETKARLDDLSNLKEGHIILSGENYVSSFIVPKIIKQFSSLYPNIIIDLVESNSPDLRLQLLSENIDLLIAHDFNDNEYSSVPLFKEQLLLAVPKSFEINNKLLDYALTTEDIKNNKHLTNEHKYVNLNIFKDCPFILMKKGNDTRNRTQILFEEQNFEPKNIIISLDQLITSFNMANSGLGIALVTDIIIKTSNGDGLVFYKLNSPSLERFVSVGYKKNKYLSKAIQEFIRISKEVYK